MPGLATAAEPEAPIVITATRNATLAIDAPASLSVVTRRDIEARGADNVLDALRGEPGLTLQGRAVGGRQVLSLRGLDSKHTLVLVDGRRIGASDGVVGVSDFEYDWIATADIERIEVVRGPLSVLFGSEAMGGVVNIVTRQPGDTWRGTATLEGRMADGSRGGDGLREAASVDGPLDAGLGLRAGVAHTQRQPVASLADPRISELEGRDKLDAWVGLVWQPLPGQRFDADLRGGNEKRRADARERTGARRYHVTENLIDRALGSLAWEADWGRREGWAPQSTQLRLYQSTIDVRNVRTEGVAVNVPQRLDDRVLEGLGRWEAGVQTWTAGAEAHNEALVDPGLPDGRSVALHRSAYVQDELSLSPALRLTAGARYDRHSLFGGEWSPRLYAVWHEDEWVLKGGYSHGFKAPNLKQIVPGTRREGPNDFIGNPALRPETSDSVEVGIGWQGKATGRGARPEAQIVLFEQRVDDLIDVRLVSPGPAPGLGTYTYENLARARMRGVEASLAAPLVPGLVAKASYAYLDAINSGTGARLDKRPRHSATVELTATSGPTRMGLRAEYSADQRLPAATTGAPSVAAPDLVLVGGHLTQVLSDSFELTLGVDNFTDVRLADKSPLFQQVEPPRTWRLVLRGRW